MRTRPSELANAADAHPAGVLKKIPVKESTFRLDLLALATPNDDHSQFKGPLVKGVALGQVVNDFIVKNGISPEAVTQKNLDRLKKLVGAKIYEQHVAPFVSGPNMNL